MKLQAGPPVCALFSTLRWPCVLAAVLVGEVADVAGTRGGDPGFYRRGRLFPGLDALEEILHVRNRAVAEVVCREDRILPLIDPLAMDGEAIAIKLQSGFRPAEFKAATVDRGVHHSLVDDVKAGVAEGCLDRVWTIPLIE